MIAPLALGLSRWPSIRSPVHTFPVLGKRSNTTWPCRQSTRIRSIPRTGRSRVAGDKGAAAVKRYRTDAVKAVQTVQTSSSTTGGGSGPQKDGKMRRILWNLLHSDSGSVAPTVGLSLFALVAIGGVGLDYARVAAMDTELQTAADQAALAAATQLDGTRAQKRATSAARLLVANRTRMASTGTPPVTIASVYVLPPTPIRPRTLGDRRRGLELRKGHREQPDCELRVYAGSRGLFGKHECERGRRSQQRDLRRGALFYLQSRQNLSVIPTPTCHPAARPQGQAWCSTRAALHGGLGTSDSWTRSEMAPAGSHKHWLPTGCWVTASRRPKSSRSPGTSSRLSGIP